MSKPMESTINNLLSGLKKKLNDNIKEFIDDIDKAHKKEIFRLIGKDLYDYSEVKVDGEQLSTTEGECNLINSKITIYDCNGKKLTTEIILTNYGQLYVGGTTFSNCDGRIHFKFWIPVDYAFIIKSMITLVHETRISPNNIYTTLRNMLCNLKENLSNGYYLKNNVDIKLMDVHTEKKKFTKEKLKQDKKMYESFKTLGTIREKITLAALDLETEKKYVEDAKRKLVKEKKEFNDYLTKNAPLNYVQDKLINNK